MKRGRRVEKEGSKTEIMKFNGFITYSTFQHELLELGCNMHAKIIE